MPSAALAGRVGPVERGLDLLGEARQSQRRAAAALPDRAGSVEASAALRSLRA